MLSPVLIFGSGIHRQWICDQEAGKHRVADHAAVLRDWSELLRAVVGRLDITGSLDDALVREMPTLQWERMVQAYCDVRDKDLRAFEGERVLRRTLVDTLREAEREVEPAVDFGKVLELREVLGRHSISLNLDSILSREKPGRLPISSNPKECLSVSHDGGTIWYPHGSALRPASATFGLRDYGGLAPFWEQFFETYKKWERREFPSREQRWSRTLFEDVRHGAAGLPADSSDSFIAYLMLAPLVIFGAGISREEWGIWWLLNQRARNLARVPEHLRPQTVIFLKACDPRLPFWATRPANVTPIIANEWPEAWVRLIGWMGTHKDMARE